MLQKAFFSLFLALSFFISVESHSTSEAELFRRYQFTRQHLSLGNKLGLNEQELKEVFKKTISHPVASPDVVGRYDPSGAIGFCFGRAMAAEFLALQMQLNPERVLKLFVIGDLRSNPQQGEWRFHVTTLVPGTDGKYYAIDPVTYGATDGFMPMETAQWIHFVRMGWDQWHGGAPRALFYLTRAETVMPDIQLMQVPEKGNKVIELSFDPRKQGFRDADEWKRALGLADDVPVFQAAMPRAEKHFFIAADEGGRDRFNFETLSVTEEVQIQGGVKSNVYHFPYNNYFQDLISTFGPKDFPSKTQSFRAKFSEPRTCQQVLGHTGAAAAVRIGLGSIRFPLRQP